jgi:transposase
MALSMDLRTRLLAAVNSGSSCRAAAGRFGVAPSTAVRWRAQQRETGDIAPKPRGGDMRSRRMEERAADILAIWERALRFQRASSFPVSFGLGPRITIPASGF